MRIRSGALRVAVLRRTRLGFLVVDTAAASATPLPARRLSGAATGSTGARRCAAGRLGIDHDTPATGGVAGRALTLERVARGTLMGVLAISGGATLGLCGSCGGLRRPVWIACGAASALQEPQGWLTRRPVGRQPGPPRRLWVGGLDRRTLAA